MSEKDCPMIHCEATVKQAFNEYLEAMKRLEKAIKLVAFCTRECAEQTEKAANYALETVHHVREALHEKAE